MPLRARDSDGVTGVKIHNVEQGSAEWFSLRMGMPSASRFKDLVTPTGKPSTSITKYSHELLAERLSGSPFESVSTFAMRRGIELEPMAADVFTFQTDLITREVGYVTNDDEKVGCSPDRLVKDIGLEIKCPNHVTHTQYLLGGELPGEHKAQVQGTMWIMGIEEYWFMSFHPQLPNFICKVCRDDKYIAVLESQVQRLLEMLEEAQAKIGEIDGVR